MDILHESILRGLTGRLTAERSGSAVQTIHLMHGEIIGAEGPDDDIWLIRRLAANGAITERQGIALTQRVEANGRLEDSMLANVPVPLQQVLRAGRFRQNVLDFLRSDGTIRFARERLMFRSDAWYGHRSEALVEELSRLDAHVEPVRRRIPGGHRLEPGPVPPAERDQARLLDLLDPSMGLQDVITYSPFEQGYTLALVRDMLEQGSLISEPAIRLAPELGEPGSGPAEDFSEELLFFDASEASNAPAPSPTPSGPQRHDAVLGRLSSTPQLISGFRDEDGLQPVEPESGDWGDGPPAHYGTASWEDLGSVFDDDLLDALVHEDEPDLPETPSLQQLIAMAAASRTAQSSVEALITPPDLDAREPVPELDASALVPVDESEPAAPPQTDGEATSFPEEEPDPRVAGPPEDPSEASTESPEPRVDVHEAAEEPPDQPSAELASALRRAEAEEARREDARRSADYNEDDDLLASHPPRTDLFDFGDEVEDDEMLMFQDHDRFRGAGQGQFTLSERLLDHVDLDEGARRTGSLPPPVEFPGGPGMGFADDGDEFGLLAMGDAESASLTHADKVVALSFGAPRLESDELQRKLGVVSEVLGRVSQSLDGQMGPGAGQASVQLLLDGAPGAYAVIFQGLVAGIDGTIDVAAATRNIRRRPEGEHRRLLDNGTMDLIERALSYAVAELDDEAMDDLLEGIAGYQQRLRN